MSSITHRYPLYSLLSTPGYSEVVTPNSETLELSPVRNTEKTTYLEGTGTTSYFPSQGSASPLGPATRWKRFVAKLKDRPVYTSFGISLLLVIPFDVFIIAVALKTHKFGRTINDSPAQVRFVKDEDISSIVALVSKVAEALSAAVFGWALMCFWTVLMASSGARLGEIKSLTMFTSLSSLAYMIWYTIKNQVQQRRYIYALLFLGAILIQFYTSAIQGLAVPKLVPISEPIRSYSFIQNDFMERPGLGVHCADEALNEDACIATMLAGNAGYDAIYFYHGNRAYIPPNANRYWQSLGTPYGPMNMYMYSYLGPLNGADITSGSILFAQNRGTLEGLIGYFGAASSFINEGVAYTIKSNTVIPVLTAQCSEVMGVTTARGNVTVAGMEYLLEDPIAPVEPLHLAASVTQDDKTLIVSFHPEKEPYTIDCAVHLGFRDALLALDFQPGSARQSWLEETPWEGSYDWTQIYSPRSAWNQPIGKFARLWLRGMGWGNDSSSNALSMFLGARGIVGTGNADRVNQPDNFYSEHYLLTMMSSGVTLGFGQERPPAINEPLPVRQRWYTATLTQYYIGIRTPWQYFLLLVVCVHIILLIGANIVIFWAREVGAPDWTDIVMLFVSALKSHRPSEPNSLVNKDGPNVGCSIILNDEGRRFKCA